MTVIQSFEHLPRKIAEQTNNSIGTYAFGAVFNRIARERAATDADKALVSTRPVVVPRESDNGNHAFVFSMGMMQDPVRFSERVGPYIDQFGPSYYVKRSNNDLANKEARLQIAQKLQGRSMVVFGNSRGGKDEVREMADPAYMDEHGQIDLLTLHSSPLTPRHIRYSGRAMLFLGALLPDTHSVAVEFAKNQQEKAREQGDRFMRGLAVASFYEAQAEIPVLLRDLPTDGSIAVGLRHDNVRKIQMISSPYDGLVRTQAAYRWLVKQSGRSDIDFEIDTTLEHGSHAGFTDRPESQIQRFEKHIATDHEQLNRVELV
ncbi:MAG: hypothetical protein JWN75_26 [Candidatus Saccharibacteria bacterium]|nr:hypothetical protein [Candidatus Saccharibacteria bacterium]